MKFSLIIATLGRRAEVDSLLDSLRAQTYQDFEVIVIDQNPPPVLAEVRHRHEAAFKRLDWHQVNFKAANLARNLGLDNATGDVITFVDDDCEYPPETLATVVRLFAENPECAVLTGKAKDKISGQDSMAIWPTRPMPVTIRNVLTLSLEFTTFYRRTVLLEERLDPRFGPGTPFGSREGPDLMLRLHYRGATMRYSPAICLLHPDKFTSITDPAFLRRTQVYEQGFGALLAKHLRLHRSAKVIAMLLWHVVFAGLLAVLKNLLLLRPGKLRFWHLLLRSRLTGFQDYFAARS